MKFGAPNNIKVTKKLQMYHLSTEVKSTSQLQTRARIKEYLSTSD